MHRKSGQLIEVVSEVQNLGFNAVMRRVGYGSEYTEEGFRFLLDYRLSPGYFTYLCANCDEPLEAHTHWKCPFAPTKFLARPLNSHEEAR